MFEKEKLHHIYIIDKYIIVDLFISGPPLIVLYIR